MKGVALHTPFGEALADAKAQLLQSLEHLVVGLGRSDDVVHHLHVQKIVAAHIHLLLRRSRARRGDRHRTIKGVRPLGRRKAINSINIYLFTVLFIFI